MRRGTASDLLTGIVRNVVVLISGNKLGVRLV